MTTLTKEAAYKLQRILSKRAGRELSDEELEQAYYSLMGFAEALVDLSEPQIEKPPKLPKSKDKIKLPIAKSRREALQYV